MEPGTVLRCLHPEGHLLTRGKIYTILGHQDDWVIVSDDSGRDNRYPLVRFRIEHLSVARAPQPSAEARPPLPALSILRAGARL